MLEIRDQYDNPVLLDYTFHVRLHAFRLAGPLAGTALPFESHVYCVTCGDWVARVKGRNGQVVLDGVGVALDADPLFPRNEIGLALEAAAVNLSLCERIGSSVICSEDTEIVHGKRVSGISDTFDIFTVTGLRILSQPYDAVASRSVPRLLATHF